ncbi:hypothetical protein [Paraburkholderia sp. J11-2]|uniref:hypothetical protein n=1 Tax=Paraburkholderia sp. J11-2 TaxID=2805431 RepID=UPI002AB745F6|nr:hypothetical protein [Paraburkholderia sp. J11-2]
MATSANGAFDTQSAPTTPKCSTLKAPVAVAAVLQRIQSDARLAFYLSSATETFDLLAAAHCEANGLNETEFRSDFEAGLKIEVPHAASTVESLLAELEFAHKIIRNGLGLMTTGQKCDWGRLNDRDGVSGEGATRAHERAAAIARAGGRP